MSNLPAEQKLPEEIRQWMEADSRAFHAHMVEQYILMTLTVLGMVACLLAMWWIS